MCPTRGTDDMKKPKRLISLIVFFLGALMLLLLQTNWFIQKTGLNVGFFEGFKLILFTMLLLSPIVLFVILLANWTRKNYREIPNDLKYSLKLGNNPILGGIVEQSAQEEYFNQLGKSVDLNQEETILKTHNIKFRGLFTAYGKKLILTKKYLLFVTENSINKKTFSQKSFKSDFDAVILNLKDITNVKSSFGFPKGFLLIETKQHDKFEIQISNPERWVSEINKLIT